MRQKIGWRHTKKTKKKISLARKGKRLSEEHKKKLSDSHLGLIPANKGKKASKETREKLRQSHLGQVAWNKGLTKDTDLRVKRYGERGSETKIEQYKNGMESPLKGRKSPHPAWNKGKTQRDDPRIVQPWLNRNRGAETKQKISKALKAKWADPAYARMMLQAQKVKPNKAESQLFSVVESIMPGEFALNVRAEIMVLGGRIPDIVNINGRKAVIELYGDYWRKGDDPQERIRHFSQFGWRTLVIWERELKNKTKLKNRLLDFNMKAPKT